MYKLQGKKTHYLYQGSSEDILPRLPEQYYSACVTDPPYGIRFMHSSWDYEIPSTQRIWKEVYRILYPGAFAAVFSSTATYHRMTSNLEDAGFEIRDQILRLYDSGRVMEDFLDSLSSEQRKLLGLALSGDSLNAWVYSNGMPHGKNLGQGWNTTLKPAHEPITLARKKLEGTAQENFLRYGTGGLFTRNGGRWPANVVTEPEPVVDATFPHTGPSRARKGRRSGKETGRYGAFSGQEEVVMGHDDVGGSAARYFYCPKADEKERGEGNDHPTVKPRAILSHLLRLTVPTQREETSRVIDPFAGSGSTILAADELGVSATCIERETDYIEITLARCRAAGMGVTEVFSSVFQPPYEE